ncbi:MAG: hypothetical protein ACK4MV_10965 [Beijerinckiaceae bacterium]
MLDRQDVIFAFRYMLGRDPENEDVIRAHMSFDNWMVLRQFLLSSNEYQANNRRETFAKGNTGYRNYTQDDISAIQRLGSEPSQNRFENGIVDWFGIKIDSQYAPWITSRAGQALKNAPFPDDTFLSDGIEYAALSLALDAAQGKDIFCSLELGAGWGPWTALSAVCARRAGFPSIVIGALEADAKRFAQMRQHLALNELVPMEAPDRGRSGAIVHELEQAAIWFDDAILHWPEASADDSGRSVSTEETSGLDYRGLALNMIPIRAIGLTRLLERFDHIDFLHVDIQGAEAEIVPRSIEALESKVTIMFIGTHSRKIEGDLIEFLHKRGWQLLREQPCEFDSTMNAPTLEGLTTKDGGLVWQAPGSHTPQSRSVLS